MFAKPRFWPLALLVNLLAGLALAQNPAAPPAGEKIPPPTPTPTPMVDTPPPADAIAATVNGQPIPEMAVFRGLLGVNVQFRDKARTQVLNYLVDNLVVEQYLTQLKVQVEAKEVEEHVEKIKTEAKKAGREYATILKNLHLSEDEFRRELTSALKWDKFVLQQGDEKTLRGLFDKNVEMFNGARVQARHILIAVPDGKKAEAEAKVVALRKQIEADVNQELAKLPTGTSDKITVEKERAKALEKAFAAAAAKESSCPSKAQGGDLGYFPRVGSGGMVEPFARVAFSLQPYQLSEPVVTEFGVHLILPVDHKPGKEVKFEDVRPFVQEVYAERLREAILNAYKPKSKIEIREKK
jgi:peptidyl-prolyl cis-trans isomerase C